MFRKALDLYEREKMAYIGKALAKPTAREVAETMLRGAIENVDERRRAAWLHAASSLRLPAARNAQSIREEVVKRGKLVKQSADRAVRAGARPKATCRPYRSRRADARA